MGVFKWLRRERVTVTTSQLNPEEERNPNNEVGTIRTEQYKRDLAEFQARRSSGGSELQETPKKRCGRHSLPVSCTDCTGDPDTSFNYEKKSALKYKRKYKRNGCHSEEKVYDGLPNIQFLFQNQVFMPGDVFGKTSFSEPRRNYRRSPEFLTQRHIEFDDEQPTSPPLFFKNNVLPFDANDFLNPRGQEEVDGVGTTKQDKNESEEKLWEAMNELQDLDHWADEQLQDTNTSRTDDSKSDASTLGLPIASSCNLNMSHDKKKFWSNGKWGAIPVQIKKLPGVTMTHIKKKLITEVNVLRKCRHPNVILLMGLYPGAHEEVHIVCERFIDSLYGILHEQNRTLSAQTAVHYACDISNALVYLKMHGYIHTELNSTCIVITSQDTAKLADLSPCERVHKKIREEKNYDAYSPEPVYSNLEVTKKPRTPDSEPLLSARSSESCLDSVKKAYKIYSDSEYYKWQAPELFEADENGFVYPCSKSDVYSLCLVLWESCNAKIPNQSHTYEKLKEAYTVWKAGMRLPPDGTYPGCLLSLLQNGLRVRREQRIDMATLQSTLQDVKENLDNMDYIVIPMEISKKKSNFSSQAWDSTTPSDSDCLSPKNIIHNVVIHSQSSSCSNKSSPIYETIRKTSLPEAFDRVDKCFLSDEDLQAQRYDKLEKDYSSACSTPISKFRERNKELTPGVLHRSDSTEYCSILSPDPKQIGHDESNQNEPATAKLSRSFTPKSYKPLHITVPEFKLDSVRDILKDQNSNEQASYNFNIKNTSLPNTPIARSNMLRKNAWLSGDLIVKEKSPEKCNKAEWKEKRSHVEDKIEDKSPKDNSINEQMQDKCEENGVSEHNDEPIPDSPTSENTVRDSYTGLKRIPDPPHDFSFSEIEETRPSWSTRSTRSAKSIYKVEEEVLANVNVKPLVAIHERWIHEANKTGRSHSLPEDNSRTYTRAVKPASHCVDTLQKSLPQLYFKPSTYRTMPSTASWRSGPWDQYLHSRDVMSKSCHFPLRSQDRNTKHEADKSTITDDLQEKIDKSTETSLTDDNLRDLIRSEYDLLTDSEEFRSNNRKSDELLNKCVAKVLEKLNEEKKNQAKSFSKVKINGNNKPLLQITFNRSGENSLQVLDNCVNVTIGDGSKEKLNLSIDDTLTDEIHNNALKRCQAFNAIQEAKSTEDLYIDDDISTHMQENFGGKVKLIPLHGSLHEILCDKEDDCCLVKVKQENGCDTIYFKCDSSDIDSRDAIDGSDRKDTVVYKRRISLVEERIKRVFPKDKRQNPVAALKKLSDKLKSRPKSEVFPKNPSFTEETRARSNSTPSLFTGDREIEVNIENVMSYQDSSSDECLKCTSDNNDFEIIEREIEEQYGNKNERLQCLEKISEENLSTIADE